MDRRMHDGHNAMTIACWPLASGAKSYGNQHYLSYSTLFSKVLFPSKILLTVKIEGLPANMNKGKNAVNQHFAFAFPIMFSKAIFVRVITG